jgi:hypothetical protein
MLYQGVIRHCEESVKIVAPRAGRIIGMAVPQLVLPGYGLFHLGFDPE